MHTFTYTLIHSYVRAEHCILKSTKRAEFDQARLPQAWDEGVYLSASTVCTRGHKAHTLFIKHTHRAKGKGQKRGTESEGITGEFFPECGLTYTVLQTHEHTKLFLWIITLPVIKGQQDDYHRNHPVLKDHKHRVTCCRQCFFWHCNLHWLLPFNRLMEDK